MLNLRYRIVALLDSTSHDHWRASLKQQPDHGASQRSSSVRKWAIRIGVVLLALEVVYLVAANYLLRSGLLLELINKKPEKTNISWDSVTTYLPGVATVENFELRSQTLKDQIYLRVARADARISLIKLATKTIHIRGVDAEDVDFRYRERLDRPPRAGHEDAPSIEPKMTEYWPEIPGYANPPDPKPEDLYPKKKKKHPWTIKITGAEVAGPIKVAIGDARIEGEGSVGGGVTVKPKESIKIHRGKLNLKPAIVTFGPEVVTRDLELDADLRFEAFPAKGAKIGDILGGITGDLVVAGELGEKATVRYVITPGITAFGAGIIDARLVFKKGVLRAGSEYSLESDTFHITVMGLDASGSASVSGHTEKTEGEHLTRAKIAFGAFQFVDPEDGSVDISGSGLELDALWSGLSIGHHVPASKVDLVIPSAQIHDMSTFNAVIPEQTALRLESGTGTVDSSLEISERIASGHLDVVAEEIILESDGKTFAGDLEVRAKLAGGDLETKSFDLSGTTIRLDKIIGQDLSEKKQEKLDAWFCDVELQQGEVTFGKPLTAAGTVKIGMYDTRPVMALLKKLGAGPGWLSMAPNIKNVEGTLDIDVQQEYLGFDDLSMEGDGFEALGWMRVDNKQTDGRLFARFKAVMAGISINEDKTKIHLSKPREWFEEQPKGPVPPEPTR